MKNGDQQAYPCTTSEYDQYGKLQSSFTSGGLTKREYFAAMAMQGCLSQHFAQHEIGWAVKDSERITKWSITIADELLKQLEDSNIKK